jgi:hypothetical protein
MIGVAILVSDWSAPNFRRIQFVVLDSTVVRDEQAFWPLLVVVGVCSAIAILFKPPTSKQSYHHSIDQKTSVRTKNLQLAQANYIRMLSSLIEYDAAVLVMVVCNLRHLSFIA